MKKLSIIMAFLAILCFGMSSAMAQNTNPAITQFVAQYFPQATVQMVMPDNDDIDVRQRTRRTRSRTNHDLCELQFPQRNHQKVGEEICGLGNRVDQRT